MADDLEQLDRMLRDRARRWRAELPPAPDLAPLRARRDRARRWYVACVAAAVLLVAGGISAGVARLDHGDQHGLTPAAPAAPTASASGSPSSTTAEVVPWTALPATNPSLPATRVPPSPGPSDASGRRACTASDLRESIGLGDGAGGTMYRRVVLTLLGSDACRLSGYPTVEPLSHGHRLDLPIQHQSSLDALFGPDAAVLVAPGRPAVITLAWAVSHSCPVVDNDELRIVLPGIATPFTVGGFGTSSCNPGEGTQTLVVGPIHAQDATPGRTTSPYDGVRASGAERLTATPGVPIHFSVTLTSKHDLPLDPCPDYTITVASDRAVHDRYALNCAAVPYRDAKGRPYLPAGVPVTFAMQADPPPSGGVSKLLWQLVTPGTGAASWGALVTTGENADRPTASPRAASTGSSS